MPGVARKRSRRILAMLPLMALGAYGVWSGLNRVVEYQPGHFRLSRFGITIAITAVCSVVAAALVLVVDPYRRPLMQRLANALWGGTIGAWLMGSPNDSQTSTGTTRPVAAAVARAPRAVAAGASAATSSASDQRFSSIEARLTTLERAQGASTSDVVGGF